MNLLNNLIGNVPEVPVKVTVENDTIIKIAVAVVMVVTITFLLGALIKIKK
jgi:hypothetical protein